MNKAFKLFPVGKDYIWGGNKLKYEYGKNLDIQPLAECWECSTHQDGLSMVQMSDGQYITLKKLLVDNPHFLGKCVNLKGELPIIVKFIDANDNLSVQVHPDDEYAMKNEAQSGKNEFWYILDAEDGASLFFGFNRNLTLSELRTAVENKNIQDYLLELHPQKGDYYNVDAGTVHAIGKGNLLVEIQQNSNITYRLFDYNRVDFRGNARELQIEKAIDVLNLSAYEIKEKREKKVKTDKKYFEEKLYEGVFFKVNRVVIKGEYKFNILRHSFVIIVCLSGEMTIIDDEKTVLSVGKGETVFIPANIEGYLRFSGEVDLLKVFI